VRVDLCAEAIRLTRLLRSLLQKPESEVEGLLALMLLNHARRRARTDADGDIVLIAEQDRSLWDKAEIAEGERIARGAMQMRPLTGYAIEAAIAALHAIAPTAADTDWGEIVELYDLLRRADASPVIALNRAVAVAMRDGPAAGLVEIDALLADGDLTGFRYAHAARADLLRRLGRVSDARDAYVAALELTQQAPERRFLERRLRELAS
jgi:RNA polymerase sigma-70 factor (ECF subfamily)